MTKAEKIERDSRTAKCRTARHATPGRIAEKAPSEWKASNMQTTKFVYYQDGDMWVGWLEEYPDYRTQGKTLAELKDNLKDIYEELTSGRIPCVRKVGELVVT